MPESEETKRGRAVNALSGLLLGELANGRPRPNRRAIEAHIRVTANLSRDEVDEALANTYDQLAALGQVTARA